MPEVWGIVNVRSRLVHVARFARASHDLKLHDIIDASCGVANPRTIRAILVAGNKLGQPYYFRRVWLDEDVSCSRCSNCRPKLERDFALFACYLPQDLRPAFREFSAPRQRIKFDAVAVVSDWIEDKAGSELAQRFRGISHQISDRQTMQELFAVR